MSRQSVCAPDYSLKLETADGYYVQLIFIIMTGAFEGVFNIVVEKNGLRLYGSNERLCVSVNITGVDFFDCDKNMIGREYTVETSKKNYQLANNKKKDAAIILVERNNPDRIILRIKDSAHTVSMDIPYTLKTIETDQKTFVAPSIDCLNPIAIMESGEMTKTVKIITKSTPKYIKLEGQTKGIRITPVDDSVKHHDPIRIGTWNQDEEVKNTYILDKRDLKSINKFFNLSRKIRCFTLDNSYCIHAFPPIGNSECIVSLKSIDLDSMDD